jgi:uncharacterized membrane protein
VAMHERRLHQLFLIIITLKGVHALIEIAGGIALYLFDTDVIAAWLWEAGRSSDWVANFAHSFTSREHEFYAFYLVSHGVVNATLVGGLMLRKLWSYPATFAVLTAFIAYQLYRYTFTGDVGLIAISVIDLIVMALTWHEYLLVKKHRLAR